MYNFFFRRTVSKHEIKIGCKYLNWSLKTKREKKPTRKAMLVKEEKVKVKLRMRRMFNLK